MTRKWFAKFWQNRYLSESREKWFRQDLGLERGCFGRFWSKFRISGVSASYSLNTNRALSIWYAKIINDIRKKKEGT